MSSPPRNPLAVASLSGDGDIAGQFTNASLSESVYAHAFSAEGRRSSKVDSINCGLPRSRQRHSSLPPSPSRTGRSIHSPVQDSEVFEPECGRSREPSTWRRYQARDHQGSRVRGASVPDGPWPVVPHAAETTSTLVSMVPPQLQPEDERLKPSRGADDTLTTMEKGSFFSKPESPSSGIGQEEKHLDAVARDLMDRLCASTYPQDSHTSVESSSSAKDIPKASHVSQHQSDVQPTTMRSLVMAPSCTSNGPPAVTGPAPQENMAVVTTLRPLEDSDAQEACSAAHQAVDIPMQSDGYLQQVESKATVEDAPEYKISRMSGRSPDSKSLASECGTQGAVGSDDGEGLCPLGRRSRPPSPFQALTDRPDLIPHSPRTEPSTTSSCSPIVGIAEENPIELESYHDRAIVRAVLRNRHRRQLLLDAGAQAVLERNAILEDDISLRALIADDSTSSIARGVIRKHAKMRDPLLRKIQQRVINFGAKAKQLRADYTRLNELWRKQCDSLEKATTARPPQVMFSGFAPTALPTPAAVPVTPHPDDSTPSRGNRRRDPVGYLGDTARTEAEFEEILAALGDADMRDPNLRAAKTTAVVPDMALSGNMSTSEMFDDENGRVTDPITYYGFDGDHEASWSDPEREAFLRGYLQWPKQFGKVIKRLLPTKTPSEAVLYYYRTKKQFDYKEALGTRGGQRKRRPGSGRRVGKGSLLAGLARQQPSILTPTAEDGNGRQVLQTADQGSGSVQGSREASSAPIGEVQGDASMQDTPGRWRDEETPDGPFSQKSRQSRVLEDGLLPSIIQGEATEGRKPVVRKRKISTIQEPSGERPARKKPATSSYWSTAEKTQVVQLLSTEGPDFARIASTLENKSAQQVRNYFFNHHSDVLANGTAQNQARAQGQTLEAPSEHFSPPKHDEIERQPFGGPRTGLFLPMANAHHSLVSDGPRVPITPHGDRHPLDALVTPDRNRAGGLNISALLNEDSTDVANAANRKREVMGEWFGRENGQGPGSPLADDAASDGTVEDVSVSIG